MTPPPLPDSSPPAVTDFDALYRGDPDPYGVRVHWYEQRKIRLVLGLLSQPHYPLVWDAACGNGELTAALAGRADRVIASDLSAEAVRLTAARITEQPVPATVQACVNPLPQRPAAAAAADLVVLSEVLYYLPDTDRHAVAELVADSAEIVVVSWRHDAADTWLSGADSVQEFTEQLRRHGREPSTRIEDTDFVAAAWATSPARARQAT